MSGDISISILMPAKNSARTISLAVRSTLRALKQEDELIVGLHGWDQEADAKLREIKDSRLRTVVISGDTLGDALNDLLTYASKEWVGRMDADDICLPWRFSFQRRALANYDFVFTTALIWYERKFPWIPVPQYPTSLTSRLISKIIEHTNPLIHPTMVTKRETLVKLGYRSVPGEDLDLWLRALLSGLNIKRLGLPSIIYRVQPLQLSQSRAYKEGWQIDSEIKSFRVACGIKERELRLGLKGSLEVLGFPTWAKVKALFGILRRDSISQTINERELN
jgi:hypothetical protein